MEWRIVCLGNSRTVDFAVQELKRYITAINPDLDIALLKVSIYQDNLKNVLWVGLCDAFNSRLMNVDDPDRDDAIYISVKDGAGIITGTNERSVLIAAYRFLRELGCRWVRPGIDGEHIPQRSLKNISVAINEKASYRHRGVCIEGAVSFDHVMRMIDWLPKIGMNGYFNQFMVPYTFYEKWYHHSSNPTMEAQQTNVEEVQAMVDYHITEIKKRGMMYHATGHGWTCEPFGIEGNSWDQKDYYVLEDTKQYFALVNGKRVLDEGIPLNTNLCYSNPEVRNRMVSAIVEYCKTHKSVDYLHFWLADGMNNYCECENCKDILPSDFYVMLLNEVDARLNEENIPTKLVFLLYVDLLWAPQNERINNPDRFAMMFAPITRTYTTSLCSGLGDDEVKTEPYIRNKLSMPKSVSENIEYLSQWQKQFSGDSFDFDYHLIWDHNYDPGGFKMAEVLFDDMKNLDKLGLNGMMSCQVQRAFFPTALGMHAMASALWNKNQSFNIVAIDYYRDIFGEHANKMKEYFEKISEMFDPPYLRIEKKLVDEVSAAKYSSIPLVIQDMIPLIEENILSSKELCTKTTWEYLRYHAQICILLSKALSEKAKGNFEQANILWEDVKDYANKIEPHIHNAFDVDYFIKVVGRSIKNKERPVIY